MKVSIRSEFSTALIRTVIATALGLALWLPANAYFKNKFYEEQRSKVLAELTPYASNLALIVNTRLALVNSLEAFVHTASNDPELRAKLAIFAEGLYAGNSGIRAIQVFPPEGYEFVFPVKTNEKVATGSLKTLLADTRPDVKADLERAIQTRLLTISGPYELKQGGLGLVTRKAIYSNKGFWGFAVVILDMPPLLEQAGIAPSVTPKLLMAIRDDHGTVFSGNPAVFENNPIAIPVPLPEHEWTIAGYPASGWESTYSGTLNWFEFIGALVLILVSILTYIISIHDSRLKVAVKRSTNALRENEGKLKEAQDMGRIGNWEYDPQTQAILWSDQVYVLYNRDPKLGPPTTEEEARYYSPETLSRLRELQAQALAQGTSVAYDFEAHIPERGNKYFSAILRTQKNTEGKAIKMFGTVQDITERKLAAQEIELLNANLEKRVAERTAELEAANRDLEAFSYSVSHDLRAPLRAISGFSRILADEQAAKLDPEGLRLCGIIGKNAESMGDLIDNLLEFSRLGRVNLTIEPIDMKLLVQSIFLDLTTEEARKHIDFTVENLPKARADLTLIRQVWTNLISNCIKFSKNRTRPEIRIDSDRKGGVPLYRIRDNGVGFDMKYAEKLFGVFQRLHRQTEYEGTGVGLAIVHRIISRHGGEIWANSTPDEGAEFSFTLSKGAYDVD